MKRLAPVLYLAIGFITLLPASDCAHPRSQNPRPEEIGVAPQLVCLFDAASGVNLCSARLDEKLRLEKANSRMSLRLRTVFITSGEEISAVYFNGRVTSSSGASSKDSAATFEVSFENALTSERKEIPVKARVVAVVAPESINFHWSLPSIIVDRYPADPETERPLPGEVKPELREHRRSPLDSVSSFPESSWEICQKEKQTKPRTPVPQCLDLMAARGVFGYRGLKLETVPGTLEEEVFETRLTTEGSKLVLEPGPIFLLEVRELSLTLPNPSSENPKP